MHSPQRPATSPFTSTVSFVKGSGGTPGLSTELPGSLLLFPFPAFSNVMLLTVLQVKWEYFQDRNLKRKTLLLYGRLQIIFKIKAMLRHENRSPQRRILKRYSHCFYSRPKEHTHSHCLNIQLHPKNPFPWVFSGLWAKAKEAQLGNSHQAFGPIVNLTLFHLSKSSIPLVEPDGGFPR